MNSDELNVVMKIVSNTQGAEKTSAVDDDSVTKKAAYKIANEIDTKTEKKSSENELQDTDISEKASKTEESADEDEKNAEAEEKVEAEDKEYNLLAFKTLFTSNEELDEVLSDFGYKNIFNLIDTDKDGVITKKEVEDLGFNLKSLADITPDDIKKLAEKTAAISEEKFIGV